MTGLHTELPQLFIVNSLQFQKEDRNTPSSFWFYLYSSPALQMKTREKIIYLYTSLQQFQNWSCFFGRSFTSHLFGLLDLNLHGAVYTSQYLRILGCNSTDAHCRMTITLETIRAQTITVLTEKCWLRHVETMIKSLNGRLVFGMGGDTKSLSLHMHAHHRQHMWCTFAY